jgi:hypothetical protein
MYQPQSDSSSNTPTTDLVLLVDESASIGATKRRARQTTDAGNNFNSVGFLLQFLHSTKFLQIKKFLTNFIQLLPVGDSGYRVAIEKFATKTTNVLAFTNRADKSQILFTLAGMTYNAGDTTNIGL